MVPGRSLHRDYDALYRVHKHVKKHRKAAELAEVDTEEFPFLFTEKWDY